MKRLLPICLLALAACSSSPSTPVGVASSPGPSHNPTAAPAPAETAVPAASIAPRSPITRVELTGSLSNDGSAQDPTTTFDHNLDRKLIAVLTLSGVGPGTKLSYVRYLDGKYVDSRSAITAGNAQHFYFEFTAPAGQTLTTGLYRLRLYVAEHAVSEVGYRVR